MDIDWAALVPELYVTDISKSLNFYVDVLDFEILFDRPEEKFAYLAMGKAQLMLEQIGDTQGRSWQTGRLEYPLGRGINFQIEVSNAAELINSLEAINHPFYRELEERWYRVGDTLEGQKQFLVQDPDGYLLRFCEILGSEPV